MTDFGNLVYESKLVGTTWLGKFGAWLENTLNILEDPRQKGSPRYNRNIVRTYLLEFTDIETVDLIEETYQVAVIFMIGPPENHEIFSFVDEWWLLERNLLTN